MLIKALCDYYDLLAAEGKVNEKGFSAVPVQYAISLSPEGKITGITDIRREKTVTDKKGRVKTEYEPVMCRFPFREKSTSIKAYRIDHRGKYIFGLSYDPDTNTLSVTDKLANDKFKEKNLEFIEGMDEPVVNAFRNFLTGFVPEDEKENPLILSLGKNLKDAGFYFVQEGFSGKPLHDADCIAEKIRSENVAEESSEGDEICAVSGKRGKIAQLHNNVKGILGQKAGTFVCVNSTAGESYGKTKAYTSNISEESMSKYTEAFNYLTSHIDPNTQKYTNKAYIDSMTVIFFAADKNSEKEDAFLRFFAFDDSVSAAALEPQIQSVMGHIQKGDALDMSEIVTDGSADYYVAGLVPNSSRVCMKFCYRDSFGRILENVLRHQRDISMGSGDKPVTVSQLTAELVSPVSKEQAPPPLISALMDSIFLGRRYPDSLLAAVINRVKTDSDTEDDQYRKINPRRVGIIKACLNRNYKEEFTVALDENRKDKAYLCGRLFAVLEKIQREAQGDLNSSIKDSYFASACSKPSVVFPRLIMLAQNHLKKLDSDYYNYLLGEIINLMEGNFPSALSIEEQGAFMIGYYQQFFLKRKSADSSDKE
ncbi:MAG: type I-C CRISPR-associated protein Cas8c/Csd1 [Huintestinicola sp.]|uniref:type I-C CRISPR-associated protein Cas8c/Csd1 n=1 Tax=Huintestinicola sp. TaxID=2981661 RepID=UPI003EFCF2D9